MSKFKAEIASKEQKIEALEEIISNYKLEKDSLNDQVKKCNRSLSNVTKLKEEKDSEVAALRTSLKNQGSEINLKRDSKLYITNLKSKEKDIYALDMKCDNLAESLERVKSENSVLVSEKKRLEKNMKQKSKEDAKFTT